MQSIIDGKVYDTAKAKTIASNDEGIYYDHDQTVDFKYDKLFGDLSVLYKTSKEKFFLYTCSLFFGSGSNKKIIPLNIKEAKEWYSKLPNRYMKWEDTFGEQLEEAYILV